MGQLTSFPLLCLVNYITFRYSVNRKVPVKINGDDIIFRATPDEVTRWERDVAKGGLTLSKGKTVIHPRFFTLNSTPFWSTRKGAKGVGFVRPSAVWKNEDIPQQIRSLNSRFYSSCSFFGSRRSGVVRHLFLEQNMKPILASRRSLTRGLGLAVDEGTLRSTKLWYRELFYLEQVEEPDIPLPRGQVPPGWRPEPVWKFTDAERKAWDRLYQCSVLDHLWHDRIEPVDSTADMSDIQSGCFPYGLPPGVKYRKMLKLSRAQAYRWACKRRNPSVFGRVRFLRKSERVMVLKDRSYSGKSVGCPQFVSSTGKLWAGVRSEQPIHTMSLRPARPKSVSRNLLGWDSLKMCLRKLSGRLV
jgi:hypothetical protein